MKEAAVKKVSKVTELAEKQLADVGDRLAEATEAATDFAHETARTVKKELQQGWEKIEDATLDLERSIRRHPFKATLIALGTGVVIGWLIGRAVPGRK
jgi:ElaB/YqjD/DUF883 family membrane-anchored ribosome-binding protein